ncbi:MAG: pilin [Candidatus Paceibacterota bacterium]|jgi:hypothetical protein
MRFRAPLFALLLVAGSLALPLAAHAAIPFLGPIIPEDVNRCAAGWGMVMIVINNIISFLITIAIIFVAPLMIAWSGFLFVVNPVNAAGKEQAKKILTSTVVGIVIALAGWLIVDAIMAVLYNPATVGQTWSQLVTSGGAKLCLPLAGSLKQVPGLPSVTIPGVASKFTFDPGIDAQVPTASGPLATLLSCMVDKVPAGVGRISSISDSLIIKGQKTFAQCATGGCQHSANSCHYGGRSCIGSSYAVDFGDEQNMSVLTAAAQACGGATLNEGTHLHVSVGAASGCGCGI